MVTHIYRYKYSYWLLFLFAFVACEIMTFGTLKKNLPDFLAGNFGIFDYFVCIALILICLPVGIFSLAVPFSARIIASPEGVEFHTISAVVKAHWSDLSIGVIHTPSGSSKTLLCSKFNISPRKWARYLPWDVESGVRELGIPFSQFGFFTSRSLFARISQYAPHLKILE